MVELALSLGASRVEIAHVQYYGWALKNRAALMPTREQVEQAVRQVEMLRTRHHGQIVIDAVVPDYYRTFSQTLCRRLGPPLTQCYAGRPGPSVSCRRSHSRVLNSGMCASTRSPISGAPRRLFWLSAAQTGCWSLANRAHGAIRILVDAGARPSSLRAMPGLPIPYVICRRTMRSSKSSPLRGKMSPTAIVSPDHADLPVSDCNKAMKGGDFARRGRAPRPFSSGPRK